MMKRSLLVIVFLIITTTYINAQNNKFESSKLIYGADLGFSISDSYWSLGLSPQIGYKISPKFHVGTGISYMHGSSKTNDFYDYKRNSYGLNVFALYYPWKKLVTKIRPDLTWTVENSKLNAYQDSYKNTYFTPSLIIGGGLHLKPIIIMLNYDLAQNKHSSIENDIFLSLGFMF